MDCKNYYFKDISDPSKLKCSKCPSNYRRCENDTVNNIVDIQCADGYYFLENAGTGTCISKCPKNYVGLKDACKKCHEDCKECDGLASY